MKYYEKRIQLLIEGQESLERQIKSVKSPSDEITLFLGSRARPVREVGNFLAICGPIV
jgi:hypothetical protein